MNLIIKWLLTVGLFILILQKLNNDFYRWGMAKTEVIVETLAQATYRSGIAGSHLVLALLAFICWGFNESAWSHVTWDSFLIWEFYALNASAIVVVLMFGLRTEDWTTINSRPGGRLHFPPDYK